MGPPGVKATGTTWDGQCCVELGDTGREQPEWEEKQKKKPSLPFPTKTSVKSAFDLEFTGWICRFGEEGAWESGCTQG